MASILRSDLIVKFLAVPLVTYLLLYETVFCTNSGALLLSFGQYSYLELGS